MVFARYAAFFVPVGDRGVRIIAVGVIVALSALNYAGVRAGSRVQTILTGAKVAAIVVLVAIGLLLAGDTAAAPVVSQVSVPPGAGFLREFLLAMVAGLFAYGGWHMVTYTAGETRMPATVIPSALVAGVAIVTACYVALNLVYLRVLPIEVVRSSTRIAADAADAVVGRGGSAMLAVLVMVSSVGALTGIILTGPRVYYSMAQDGLAPRWLGHIHPVHRTPSHAIVAQALWASALAATGAYRQVFTRVIYTEWLFFALMAAGPVRAAPAPRLQPGVPDVGLSDRAAGVHRGVAGDRDQPVRQHAAGSGHGPRVGRARRAGLLLAPCASLISTITTIRPRMSRR